MPPLDKRPRERYESSRKNMPRLKFWPVIRFLADRFARLFSSRLKTGASDADATWARHPSAAVASPFSDDDDELAETRLISDPSSLRAALALPSNDESGATQRLSWPARDAAPGARRAYADEGPPPEPDGEPDDTTRMIPSRPPRHASVTLDEATVLLQAGKAAPRIEDDATVLVTSRKRPGA